MVGLSFSNIGIETDEGDAKAKVLARTRDSRFKASATRLSHRLSHQRKSSCVALSDGFTISMVNMKPTLIS